MLKVSTKARILDFGRARIGSLRALLGGIPWKASMEDEGARKCWGFFKNVFLEKQNQFISSKSKGSRWGKRPPWLNCKLLSLLKTKRKSYQKWILEAGESYKDIARACTDAVRKAKSQLELKLAMDVKIYKN